MSVPAAVVDVAWLAANLAAPNLIVLDASIPPVVPGLNSVNAEGRFKAIPGARRFDYDKDVCKPDTSLPHMLPGPEIFERKVRALGVNADSALVVYDDCGMYASPRAWWMFRAMGHDNVAVLSGGLPAWIAAKQSLAGALIDEAEAGNFTADFRPHLVSDYRAVLEALENDTRRVLDARPPGRFRGVEPEPRPGLRGGHMPNAENLPFVRLLENGVMKPADELREIFAEFGAPERRLISSCGSGITACVIALAAHEAGLDDVSVYDGSWVEWGTPGHLPVVTD
ncbi:MAG: sulfurtransferase [Gammaproteobacteria bacterium]|nr:sulfurtransferase [Gammaproteobacteria bacterium]MYH47081.1 sulfurtransferase [Gammaproteobacteria bacterium]MYL14439.1 sulfurtransferase [Gammaproteobacteria bacterium]